jgi:DNA polymerase
MNKKEQLDRLKQKMLGDKNLPLRESATNLVFGDGSLKAEVVFVGEGPGYWEDVKGLPFVGNSGALLNQLLVSIKLPREDVFITNVVHYRPPNNRDPLPEELAAFKPYLDEIIKIIDPKVIVTLGRFSMAKFFPGVTIGSVHGKPCKVNLETKEIIIVPMYHPAAGLRNGEFKRRLFEDFKKIPEVLAKFGLEQKEVKEEKAEQMELI